MRSGMRKLVRTPPTSTACIDSRGKPSTRMPTSVEVPPTSITRASLSPASALAPRMELVGPEASVKTGYLTACSAVISVPSFWVR